MGALSEQTRETLRANLSLLRHDVVLDLDAPDDDPLTALVEETAAVSDRVHLRRVAPPGHGPVVTIRRATENEGRVRFRGTPGGHEFTSFVLALLHVGGHPPKRGGELITTIGSAPEKLHFTTFYSQTCQNCPEVVQALNSLAALAPNVTAEAVDGAAFVDEIAELNIRALPTVLVNGEPFHQGRADTEELLAKIGGRFGARNERGQDPADAAAGATTDPIEHFDVVVVGGGPAGVSAAVYAARKGLRTGVVAERIGGQVLDTAGIENLVALRSTTGLALAATLEEDLAVQGVAIFRGRTVRNLQPGRDTQQLQLSDGRVLTARGVVLAPGARWRLLGVPGEDEYRNKGVTFCPHCDGPLFRGQRVAVIGGGNSGLEAAIDLAGICEHVTVVEYAEHLRADSVLVDAARRRSNIELLTGAESTAIEGNGRAVTSLVWRDRSTGEPRSTAIAGVFVQIGLLPNTDWLDGVVRLNERGEIEIDEHGRTSVPRVTAAGDATTAPYKQIVSALGSGATAAIALFEELAAAAD